MSVDGNDFALFEFKYNTYGVSFSTRYLRWNYFLEGGSYKIGINLLLI